MTRGHKIYLIPVLSKPIGFHRRDTLKPSGRIGSKKTISNLHTARISLMGNSTPNLLHKDTDIRGISLHTQPTHDAPTERRQAASTKHKHGRGKQKREISHAAAPQYLSSSLWCHQESNRGHKDFQSFALPTELWHHHKS